MRYQNFVVGLISVLSVLTFGGCSMSNPFQGVQEAGSEVTRLFTSEVRLQSLDAAEGDPDDPVNRRVIADGALLLPSVADGFLFKEAYDIERRADGVDADIAKMSSNDPKFLERSREAATLHRQALERELVLTNQRLQQAVADKEGSEANRQQAIREGLSTTVIDNKITDLEGWRKFLQTHRDLIQGRISALG